MRRFFSFYWKTYKSSPYLKSLLLSFLLLSGLLFGIFAFIITSIITKTANDNLNQMAERGLVHAENTNNAVLSQTYNFYYSAFTNNPQLIALLSADAFTSDSSWNASRLMSDLLTFNQEVSSIYVINERANFVCSNYDTYRDQAGFYDQDILKVVGAHKGLDTILYMPRHVVFEASGKKYDERLLTIVFFMSSDNVFVVNLDQNRLTGMTNAPGTSDVKTIILNQGGQVISHSDGKLFAQDWSKNRLFVQSQATDDSSGSFNAAVDGANKRIVYLKDNTLGFTYLAVLPRFFGDYSNSARPVLLTIACSIAFILLNIALSFALSWQMYSPVQALKNEFASSTHPKFRRGYDEFLYLSQTFKSMRSQYRSLLKDEMAYRAQKKAQVLGQILTLREGETVLTPEKAEELGISLDGPSFRVCILRLENAMDELPLLRYALANIAEELLAGYSALAWKSMTDGTVACILNDGPAWQRGKLEEALQAIQNAMQTHFGIWVTVGVGVPVGEPEEIAYSNQTATEALQYRFLFDTGSIISYEELLFTPEDKQVYPDEAERAIAASFRTARPEDLRRAVDCFFAQIRHYRYQQILSGLLRLYSEIERLEQQYEIHIADKLSFDTLTLQSTTFGQLRERILEHCAAAMSYLHEARANSSGHAELVRQAKETVDRHITDGELSVESVAREIHLSSSYLRNIFKSLEQESLSSYITRKKLDAACRFLADTDLSIQDISDRMGFTSRNYFHTFFKKHMHVTPDQYRCQNRTK